MATQYKKVFGIGVIEKGDVPIYSTGSENVRLLSLWRHMFDRCYSSKFHNKRPTYIGCSVNERFHKFQDFVSWSSVQVGGNIDGWQLDKDILVKGNKVYGPDTCAFVPPRINKIFMSNRALRGGLPIGVSISSWVGSRGIRYVASIQENGKAKQLGTFLTPELAFMAYKKRKEELVRQVAEEYRAVVDPRVYAALIAYQVEITD